MGALEEMNELELRGSRRRKVVASPTPARASLHFRTRRRKLKTIPRVNRAHILNRNHPFRLVHLMVCINSKRYLVITLYKKYVD